MNIVGPQNVTSANVNGRIAAQPLQRRAARASKFGISASEQSDGVIAGISDRRFPAQRSFPRYSAAAWQRRDRNHITANGDGATLRPRGSDERSVAATADELRAFAHHAAARCPDRPAQAAGRGGGPAGWSRARHRRLQDGKRNRRRSACRPSCLLHWLRIDACARAAISGRRRRAGEVFRAGGRAPSGCATTVRHRQLPSGLPDADGSHAAAGLVRALFGRRLADVGTGRAYTGRTRCAMRAVFSAAAGSPP